jgi:hypothetical protein
MVQVRSTDWTVWDLDSVSLNAGNAVRHRFLGNLGFTVLTLISYIAFSNLAGSTLPSGVKTFGMILILAEAIGLLVFVKVRRRRRQSMDR